MKSDPLLWRSCTPSPSFLQDILKFIFSRNKAKDEQKKVLDDMHDEELAGGMYEKLDNLIYLEQCLKEVTRLYFTVMLPPRKVMTPFRYAEKTPLLCIRLNSRNLYRCLKSIYLRVETMEIPTGSYLCISPIISHSDGNIFPESQRFFPGRFDPRHGKNPFGNKIPPPLQQFYVFLLKLMHKAWPMFNLAMASIDAQERDMR